MCPEVHPDGPDLVELRATEVFDEEQLATHALQDEQLDWEATAAGRAAAMAEIASARAELQDELAEAGAELAEVRAEMGAASAALAAAPPLSAAPLKDTFIHDITADDDDDHIQFSGEQRAPLASFESLLGDADRR
jgi:hypothetical protein